MTYAVLFSLTGMVEVEADSPQEAKEHAAEMTLTDHIDDWKFDSVEEIQK